MDPLTWSRQRKPTIRKAFLGEVMTHWYGSMDGLYIYLRIYTRIFICRNPKVKKKSRQKWSFSRQICVEGMWYPVDLPLAHTFSPPTKSKAQTLLANTCSQRRILKPPTVGWLLWRSDWWYTMPGPGERKHSERSRVCSQNLHSPNGSWNRSKAQKMQKIRRHMLVRGTWHWGL